VVFLILVPLDLPDGVRMLGRLHRRLVDGFFVLRAHVVDKHGSIIAPDLEELGVLFIPIKAAHPALRAHREFREVDVLETEAADDAC